MQGPASEERIINRIAGTASFWRGDLFFFFSRTNLPPSEWLKNLSANYEFAIIPWFLQFPQPLQGMWNIFRITTKGALQEDSICSKHPRSHSSFCCLPGSSLAGMVMAAVSECYWWGRLERDAVFGQDSPSSASLAGSHSRRSGGDTW